MVANENNPKINPCKSKRPNFFIVGAPKCGTTSLSVYLSKHPDVFFAKPKEPLFFGSDLKHAWRLCTQDEYFRCFRGVNDERVVGEGTVWYLYSRNAAQEIRTFSPSARIIIMLRNPVDMIHSLYHQFRVTCNESLERFEDAIAAQERRAAGIDVPANAHFPAGLQYYDVGRYAHQVERYLEIFGRDAVHVIQFEDFIKDTEGVFRQTLDFLALDTTFRPEFTRENPTRTVIFPRLNQWIRKPPAMLTGVKNYLPPGMPRDHLKNAYQNVRSLLLHRLNRRQERMKPSDAIRQRIIRALERDIRRLEDVLGTDLSHWLAPVDLKPVDHIRPSSSS